MIMLKRSTNVVILLKHCRDILIKAMTGRHGNAKALYTRRDIDYVTALTSSV